MPTTLRITTLGSFSVSLGDTVLSGQAAKSRRVWRFFQYLIVHRARPVPVSALIDALWPGEEPENPLPALYSLAHRLRRLLTPPGGEGDEPCFLYANGAYRWNPAADVWLDADEFERLLAEARAPGAGTGARAGLLRRAAGLYHGDFLAEASGEMWVLPTQTRLRELFGEAARELARQCLDAGAPGDALEIASKAVAADPYSEDNQALYLRAQIRLGHYDQARRHFEQVTEMLYDAYDVRPSEALRAVMDEIPRREREGPGTIQEYMERLGQSDEPRGAFVCGPDLFRSLYQWQRRLMPRSGLPVFLALVTLADGKPDKDKGGSAPTPRQERAFADAVALMADHFAAHLRRADVVCQPSPSQISLLMTCLTYEDCKMVVERLASGFFTLYRQVRLRVAVKVSELETGD